jgi:hypothetical protein
VPTIGDSIDEVKSIKSKKEEEGPQGDDNVVKQTEQDETNE